MLPMGTHANLPVSAACKAAVEGAADASTRAVKVVVDGEELVAGATVPESASLEDDFAALAASLEEDKPCIALIRLKGSDRFEDTDWALVAYTPDSAPVKARMLNASSIKPLQAVLSDIKFTEYQVTMKSEVTLAQFLESTKELTEKERREMMSQKERDLADVKKATAKEQSAAPKMLAGLVALKIKAHDSFDDAVKTLLAEEGKAALGRLCGDNNEEVSGEVLSDISAPSALKGGKLSSEEPSYIILKPTATRLCLISWLPEFTPVKKRMKLSTFKASLLEHIKELAPVIESIVQAEITTEEDLTDDVWDERVSSSTGGYAGEAAAPKMGFKPPVGGFALPGMGGGKPPPGAMKLPGM